MREAALHGALQGSVLRDRPCQISKQVKVCVPETVMVRKAAWSRLRDLRSGPVRSGQCLRRQGLRQCLR